ncbi:hypothetical protein SAMN02910371_03633 [Butyrivibrio sp. INlla14]|nr:hypothetical protein SAMN02910371_03633 [Butyrivibrio sp. INlla14]
MADNKKWVIYIVSHNTLYKQMYFHDSLFGRDHFQVLNVGSSSIKDSLGLDVIDQKSLDKYLDLGKWWAESEGIYNIWRSQLWKELDYIGFIHYDLELRLDDRVVGFPRTDITSRIEDYLADKKDIHISFETHDFEEDYNQKIMADEDQPDKLVGDGRNCYDYILEEYNNYYGTNFTKKDLIKRKQINLCSCFMMNTDAFNNMMLFWDYIIKTGELLKFDSKHLYRFQGGMAERFFGVWMALRYSECLDLSLVHHYNDGLKNDLKTKIIVKRKDEKVGLASFFNTTLGAVDYLTRKGYTPIVCDEKRFGWNKWFNSEKDYDESAKVFDEVVDFRPDDSLEILYNDELIKYWNQSWKNLIGFDKNVIELLEYEKRMLLGGLEERTVGVLARGTDYIALEPKGHPRQPKPEDLFPIIDNYLSNGYERVFVATEDTSILESFKKKYNDKLIYRVNTMCTYSGHGYLSEQGNEKESDKKNYDYLVNIYILSCCKCFVGGRTSGTVMAFVLSGGYKDSYLWNRGRYGDEKSMSLDIEIEQNNMDYTEFKLKKYFLKLLKICKL